MYYDHELANKLLGERAEKLGIELPFVFKPDTPVYQSEIIENIMVLLEAYIDKKFDGKDKEQIVERDSTFWKIYPEPSNNDVLWWCEQCRKFYGAKNCPKHTIDNHTELVPIPRKYIKNTGE